MAQETRLEKRTERREERRERSEREDQVYADFRLSNECKRTVFGHEVLRNTWLVIHVSDSLRSP